MPSNSPHDHMILRVDLVDAHGRWKRSCLQTTPECDRPRVDDVRVSPGKATAAALLEDVLLRHLLVGEFNQLLPSNVTTVDGETLRVKATARGQQINGEVKPTA